MTQNFLPSQHKCIEKLSKVKVGALFMEPGTGKTRIAIELIRSCNPDYVLWVTPFQTKANLLKELDKWSFSCDIIGIETIQCSDRIYLDVVKKIESSNRSFIIMDESLKIKNIEAKRTKRLIELSKISSYRLILNGTPLSKNLLDLWSQMEFLSPKILKMDYAEFKNTFVEYVKVTTRHTAKQAITKEFIRKYHNMDHLYRLIEPFIFESKLSLSIGTQHINIPFDLTDDEQLEHQRLKEKYLDPVMMSIKNNNLFMEITQKMQNNYSLSPEKMRIVKELLSGTDNGKVLIYAKYIKSTEKLRKTFPSVKVMSIQKHSYGLNLQDYNVIIFWDKTWDYALREQIERRIYRTGQNSECIYYDLTGNVGLENLINQNIQRKRNLLDVFAGMSIEQLNKLL